MVYLKRAKKGVQFVLCILLIQYVVGFVQTTMDGVAYIGFPLVFIYFGGFPYAEHFNSGNLIFDIIVCVLVLLVYVFKGNQNV